MMENSKATIIAQLQKEILSLQGIRSVYDNKHINTALGPIKNAFPNASFPIAAIHEFISNGMESATVTSGFVSGLLGCLMNKKGAAIWISSTINIFPPALQLFGIDPGKIIFINPKKEKEMLLVMEEALKCTGLSAVIGEIPELNFTASRRLQLAVEQSHVTGFILRRNPKNISTTACVTRWNITSLPSKLLNDMPGVGFPRWNVELLKVRNGKPHAWQIEWREGRFRQIAINTALLMEQKKKAG